jgi:hypothetical protein
MNVEGIENRRQQLLELGRELRKGLSRLVVNHQEVQALNLVIAHIE